MYITKITLSNYRSFQDETEISLEPGMNLLLGENNSGKSSILQALSLDALSYEPHLSLMTKPSSFSQMNGEQRVGLELSIGKSETWKYLGERAIIPIPLGMTQETFQAHLQGVDSLDVRFESNMTRDVRHLRFYQRMQGALHGSNNPDNQSLTAYRFLPGIGMMSGAAENHGPGSFNTLFQQQWNTLRLHLYRFRAERLNIHQSGIGPSTTLG